MQLYTDLQEHIINFYINEVYGLKSHP